MPFGFTDEEWKMVKLVLAGALLREEFRDYQYEKKKEREEE